MKVPDVPPLAPAWLATDTTLAAVAFAGTNGGRPIFVPVPAPTGGVNGSGVALAALGVPRAP